jgi:hypothetical protein
VDRNSRDRGKKLATEPEPPAEVKPPIESEPISGQYDVSDLVGKQLDENGSVKQSLEDPKTLTISGKGRFYLFKKDEQAALAKQEQYLWGPNVEVSCEIRVDEIVGSDKRFINIGGTTNHFADVDGNSNGRNYSLVFRLDRGGLGFKKETIHGVYDEYHKKDDKMELGKWYKIRFRQSLDAGTNGHMVLEGWVNDEPVGMFIDDGTMTRDISKVLPVVASGDKDALYSPIKNGVQIWDVGAYSGCYIRLSGTIKTLIKNLSVREL